MVKIHKILTGLALWGIISAGAVLCPVWAGAKTEKYTNTDFAMNTVVSETLYTTGKNLNPSVGELLKNTEENLLSWTEEDSQIAALNAAQGKTLEVSDELAGYLEKIQQLSKERAAILAQNGYPKDYLDMHYDCPLCKDTGYIGSEKCACFQKAAVDLLYTQSNIRSILNTENFSHFSFDYYSSDFTDASSGITSLDSAKNAYEKSWDFIDDFPSGNNLLIYGDTGVGKTYLAAFDSKNYKRVLFVAHREEILNQAALSFKNVRNSDDYGFFTGKSKENRS